MSSSARFSFALDSHSAFSICCARVSSSMTLRRTSCVSACAAHLSVSALTHCVLAASIFAHTSRTASFTDSCTRRSFASKASRFSSRLSSSSCTRAFKRAAFSFAETSLREISFVLRSSSRRVRSIAIATCGSSTFGVTHAGSSSLASSSSSFSLASSSTRSRALASFRNSSTAARSSALCSRVSATNALDGDVSSRSVSTVANKRASKASTTASPSSSSSTSNRAPSLADALGVGSDDLSLIHI